MQTNSTTYQADPGNQERRENPFERIMHTISHFFGSGKTRSEEVQVVEDDMSDDEFKAEFEKLPANHSSLEASRHYPSLFEMSFLNKMIDGKYDGYTLDLFRIDAEKKLFLKYKSLNQDQKMEKYKQMEQQLNGVALK